MVDAIFGEPKLAEVYDAVDDDRRDLDAYVGLVDELRARSVLDVGCGTGTFACRLAQLGIEVTGIDPAVASLAVARRKPGARRVRWLTGDATNLPQLQVDLATMTGNVAQVFLTDEGWRATLEGIRLALRPGGSLAFEVRDPGQMAWREWTRERSRRRVDVPGQASIVTWVEVTDVELPFVSFQQTFVFEDERTVLTSESTLRFRNRSEISESLTAAGLSILEVRDAPDRPGLEFVFVATAPEEGS